MPVHRPIHVRRAAGALAACALLLGATAAEAKRPAGEGGSSTPATGTVQVNSGYSLTVRDAPRSSGKKVRSVADGATVKIVCQTTGQKVSGRFGTSTTWDRLAKGGYVSDTYVYTGSDGRVAPDCAGGGTPGPKPSPEPEPQPKGWPKDLKRAADPATYDDAAAWAGGANCSGGFTRGAKLMQGWLRAGYGKRMSIGGYSCRPNTADTSKTSIHGVGRANDWFRDANDPAQARDAASFIRRMSANGGAMAHAMGVQYFIWNGREYHVGPGGVTVDGYGGPNPHTDHVHIELNVAGGKARTTYWKKAIRAGRG